MLIGLIIVFGEIVHIKIFFILRWSSELSVLLVTVILWLSLQREDAEIREAFAFLRAFASLRWDQLCVVISLEMVNQFQAHCAMPNHSAGQSEVAGDFVLSLAQVAAQNFVERDAAARS